MKRLIALVLLALFCNSCATVGAAAAFNIWSNGVTAYAIDNYDPNAKKKLKYNEWE